MRDPGTGWLEVKEQPQGTTASPLPMYREMPAAGILLPSMLLGWGKAQKRQSGEDKRSQKKPPRAKRQEVEKRNITGEDEEGEEGGDESG